MSEARNERKELNAPSGYVQIGWIAHGMDKMRVDNYKAMFGNGKVRVPPKIYKTENVAARYGKPTPVFIKHNKEM